MIFLKELKMCLHELAIVDVIESSQSAEGIPKVT